MTFKNTVAVLLKMIFRVFTPEMSGVTFFDSDSYSYSELLDSDSYSDSEKFENANSDSEISLMIKILNTRDEVRSG